MRKFEIPLFCVVAMAFSAEPGRKTAYGKDLRWRIIYQRIAMGLKFAKIASNLNIAVSTAHKTYRYFEQTGNVVVITSTTTKRYETARRKLSKQNELFIIGVVLGNSSMFMHEVCQEVRDVFGIVISPPTICRLLHSHGITRKKIRQIELQHLIPYVVHSEHNAHCFIQTCLFLLSMRQGWTIDHIRRYGYALRGVTPEYTQPFCGHGQRINAIVGISTDGVTAVELTTSAVNTDIFFDFAWGSLIPNMHQFNGTNPQSIAVMDNLSVYHTNPVIELFNQACIPSFFLPPYSPDLNPAKECFSYVKNYLRKHDTLLQMVRDPTPIIRACFFSVTKDHSTSWIQHSGYCKLD